MSTARHFRNRGYGPVRQNAKVGMSIREVLNHLLHRNNGALGGERCFLLDADDSLDQHIALLVGLLRMDKGDVGTNRGNGGKLLSSEGAGDGLDVRIDLRQSRPAI